jgi:predicted transposase YdaD
VFSDPANAVAHFAVCLPPELVAALDLSKATHVPGSWVDEALRDRHSGVVHSVPFRSACSAGADANDGQTESVLLHTIWEHQSTVDEMMSFRLEFRPSFVAISAVRSRQRPFAADRRARLESERIGTRRACSRSGLASTPGSACRP